MTRIPPESAEPQPPQNDGSPCASAMTASVDTLPTRSTVLGAAVVAEISNPTHQSSEHGAVYYNGLNSGSWFGSRPERVKLQPNEVVAFAGVDGEMRFGQGPGGRGPQSLDAAIEHAVSALFIRPSGCQLAVHILRGDERLAPFTHQHAIPELSWEEDLRVFEYEGQVWARPFPRKQLINLHPKPKMVLIDRAPQPERFSVPEESAPWRALFRVVPAVLVLLGVLFVVAGIADAKQGAGTRGTSIVIGAICLLLAPAIWRRR